MSGSDKSMIKLRDLAFKYREGLDKQERTRYDGKLKLIGGEDSYEMTTSVWLRPDDVKPIFSPNGAKKLHQSDRIL